MLGKIKTLFCVFILFQLNACQTMGYAGNGVVQNETKNIISDSVIGDIPSALAGAAKQGSRSFIQGMFP